MEVEQKRKVRPTDQKRELFCYLLYIHVHVYTLLQCFLETANQSLHETSTATPLTCTCTFTSQRDTVYMYVKNRYWHCNQIVSACAGSGSALLRALIAAVVGASETRWAPWTTCLRARWTQTMRSLHNQR